MLNKHTDTVHVEAGAGKPSHLVKIKGFVLEVVRQIFTAITQRTESELKSQQTKDTVQDRVRSEVTVRREMLRHSKEVKPDGGKKIKRAKQSELN